MSQTFKVFTVDDDPFILDVIRGILEANFLVETFTSVDACQHRLETEKPDMFLLDVRMPDKDGYSFCRQIKADYQLRQIPVTFISSQDSIDDRVCGYDAGGEDFVVKPFEPEELLRKVNVAQQIAQNKLALKQQLDDSELLSSLVMANMDEYAILVRFIRELISWNTDAEISTGIIEMLQRYRLEGVVQVRISRRILTTSAKGVDLPLEVSVVNHVRGLERIFEFRNRSVYNYDRLTMMVNNMPVEDPDFCGRLRDHLCIAAECAEARLKAIETEEASLRSESGIAGALERMRVITENIKQASLRDRVAGSDLLFRMEQGMASSFVHLGLSEDQERNLGDSINAYMKDLLELLDRGAESADALNEVGEMLTKLTRHG